MFSRHSNTRRARCLWAIFCVTSIFAQCFAQTGVKPKPTTNAANKPAIKAQVMVLGIYHFTAKNDVYNAAVDNLLSTKRQAEIVDLIAHLRVFKPTKVIIEAPYGDVKQNERYAQYLAGKLALKADEVDQIGFRLAKELEHKQLYPVDRKTPFDLDPVKKFAEQNGQSETLKRAFAGAETLTREISERQRHSTVREMLRYLNSEEALQLNHSIYLLTNKIGKDDSYPGVELVSEWYKRNLLIFSNIQRLVESPQDRLLVIYGQGHAKLFRQFIQDSPDLELVEANKFL
jgi:hypothetical protein